MALTVGKRISLGFAACVIVTIALGVFAYSRVTNITDDIHVIADDALPGVTMAGEMNVKSEQAANLLLLHILATTKEATAAVEAQVQHNAEERATLHKAYEAQVDQAEDRQNFAHLKDLEAAFVAAEDKALILSRDLKTKEALDIFNSECLPAANAVSAQLDVISKWNNQYAEDSSAHGKATAAASERGVVVGLGLSILLASVLGYWIVRSLNRKLSAVAETLNAGAQQLAAAATQVSGSSQSIAQGASEQAASLEETTSALEEIASMTQRNSHTAQQANTLSTEAQQSAQRGNTAMGKMSTAIRDIEKSADETAKIIRVIDEIAFQTNLLALNAAVEAARAGEAGKGFAVVAEEVRNLAMRSAEAAKNTSRLIEESVNNSKHGVNIASEVATVLGEITGSSTKSGTLVGEIAAASKEQTQGITQVSTAVAQMDKVVQANAAAAEESASAAEELASQATQVRRAVGDLLMMVQGTNPESETSAPAAAHRPRRMPAPVHASAAAKGKQLIPFSGDDEAAGNTFAEFGA